MTERAVVVTTQHRGVFFGYLNDDPVLANTITLQRARMCVYWPSSSHGVLGLASDGPGKGAKVSPAVPRLALIAVTAVMDATARAVRAWENEPW